MPRPNEHRRHKHADGPGRTQRKQAIRGLRAAEGAKTVRCLQSIWPHGAPARRARALAAGDHTARGSGAETPTRQIAGRRAMAPVGAHALLLSDVFGRPVMDPGACSTGVFEVDARSAAVLSRIGGNAG
jgi:hypothetical protein